MTPGKQRVGFAPQKPPASQSETIPHEGTLYKMALSAFIGKHHSSNFLKFELRTSSNENLAANLSFIRQGSLVSFGSFDSASYLQKSGIAFPVHLLFFFAPLDKHLVLWTPRNVPRRAYLIDSLKLPRNPLPSLSLDFSA